MIKMSQLKYLMVLIPLMLFLAGCGGQETPTNVGGAFLGGTEGLTVTFEPLSVMEDGIYTIFDTEDFPLEVILNNRGEENLPAGKATLRLLGPAKTDFLNIPSWELSNIAELEKKSEFNLEGGEEVISFTPNDYAQYTNEVIGYVDLTWNLEYEYDYKTHLIINDVCFKGDPTDDTVCTLQEARTASVSGAPITVSTVEEDTGGKGIVVLKINVLNSGLGKSTITGEEFDNRFDQIGYTVDEPEKWLCRSGGRENEARLINGAAQIICQLRQPLAEDEVYQRSVKLTLDYTYKELIQEKLRIKESAE